MVLNVELLKQHIHKMSVVEMNMLKWIRGNIQKYGIRIKEIRFKIEAALLMKI